METRSKAFRGERLRYLRKERGLSQTEAALRVQSDQSQYAKYENNRATPSLEMAARIAQEFEVSLDWLVGLSDRREPYRVEQSEVIEERLLGAFREGDLETLLRMVVDAVYRRRIEPTKPD